MRKYAYLREPMSYGGHDHIVKIMLYDTGEDCCLFGYCSPDAVCCSFDLCYGSPEELYEDWNALIDERGWIEIGDPLPDCQHDAWIPIRVRGRDIGKPEWGQYETLRGGEWVEYKPV